MAKANRRALSMSLVAGLVLLVVFLMILLMAYIQMGKAGGTINASLESNLSRLTGITENLG